MNSRNLLPVQRQIAKRRGRAMRRWVLINSTYAALLVLVAAGYVWSTLDRAQPGNMAGIGAEMERTNSTLAGLRQESVSLKATLQSVMEVSSRPDWSTLLVAVARTLGDDVALNSVASASDIAGAAGAAGAVDAAPRRILISGVGRSQQAVTRFVLGIETLRFFDRVQLLQTAPRSVQGVDGIGFQLVCDLPDVSGGR